MYLGVKFSADNRWKENWIEEWSAVGALQKQVFGSEELSKNAKAEVYNAMV